MNSDEQEGGRLSPRDEGRALACEAVLYSQFGRRQSTMSDAVLKKLGEQERVVEARRISFRRFALPLAVAAGLLVLAAGWWVARQVPDGEWTVLVETSPGTQVVNEGQEARTVRSGEKIRAGERLVTARGGHAKLVVENASSVEMNGGTTLLIGKLGVRPEMTLDQGNIYVNARSSLRLNPGREDQVVIQGTGFELARLTDGTARVRVADGKVQFGKEDRSVAVKALHESEIKTGCAPRTPTAIMAAAIAEWRIGGGEVVLEDLFVNETPGSAWAKADPPSQVLVKNGNLVLRSRAVEGSRQSTEALSKPVELLGRPLEFAVTRNTADGVARFLGEDGKPDVTLEFLDESGESLCSIVLAALGQHDMSMYFRAGRGEPRATWTTGGIAPTTFRLLLHPDGRIVWMQGQAMPAIAACVLGREISKVSLRVSISTEGKKEAMVRFTRVAARRLDRWPDWAERGKLKVTLPRGGSMTFDGDKQKSGRATKHMGHELQ